MEFLAQHIESLVFTAQRPISFKEIEEVLEATFETPFEKDDIEGALTEIETKYKQEDFAFEMVGIANGYQFLTKGAYFNTVATYLKQTTKKKLSRAALETLSIIAYKQPVSRPEMEKIRGVSCDYALQKLLEKELVNIVGRSESVGKPLLYGTSEKFMDYFGLKSISDLPKPKDFKSVENTIGEAAPIEEDVPSSTGTSVRVPLPTHPSGITEIVGDIMSAVLSLDEDAPQLRVAAASMPIADKAEIPSSTNATTIEIGNDVTGITGVIGDVMSAVLSLDEDAPQLNAPAASTPTVDEAEVPSSIETTIEVVNDVTGVTAIVGDVMSAVSSLDEDLPVVDSDMISASMPIQNEEEE